MTNTRTGPYSQVRKHVRLFIGVARERKYRTLKMFDLYRRREKS